MIFLICSSADSLCPRSSYAGLEPCEVSILFIRKLLKCSILHNLALVDDDNPIAFLNGRHPMGNDNRSSALHGAVQSLLHNLLALLVQRRRRLVQNQDLRVLNQGASDGHSLLLASRELRAFESANLLESRMQLLLLCVDFVAVNELVEKGLVLVFNNCSAFQANVVLEVIVGFRSKRTDFLFLLQVCLDGLSSKLALIHLQCKTNLTPLLTRQICAMLVQIAFNVLRLIVEQKAAQDALPSHICLVGLVRDGVEEYLEARFDFSETIHAQVWCHVVDYDQFFVADSLLIDQLKY